jgi:hypothetical protein
VSELRPEDEFDGISEGRCNNGGRFSICGVGARRPGSAGQERSSHGSGVTVQTSPSRYEGSAYVCCIFFAGDQVTMDFFSNVTAAITKSVFDNPPAAATRPASTVLDRTHRFNVSATSDKGSPVIPSLRERG